MESWGVFLILPDGDELCVGTVADVLYTQGKSLAFFMSDIIADLAWSDDPMETSRKITIELRNKS